MAFSSSGLFSGRIISSFNYLFTKFSWVLALYPALMSLRGDISGVFTGKLSTMLNTGRIYAKFRGNSIDFYSLIRGIFFLVYIDAFSMAFLTFTLNYFVGNALLVELSFYVMASIFTCVLASLLTLPLTILIAFVSYRRGLDPDIIVYPSVAILNDVMVAFSYACVISLLGFSSIFSLLPLFTINFLLIIYLLFHVKGDLKILIFKSTIKESSPLLIITSLDGVINGVLLSGFSGSLARSPGVLLIYPVLLNSLGGVGSIFGSLTTTRLALGFIEPHPSSIWSMFSELLGVVVSSSTMSIFYSVLGYLFAIGTGIKVPFLGLLSLSFSVSILGSLLIAVFSFFIGIISFRWGLDPDNVVIPVESSLADILGTVIILVLSFIIFRWF